jgi:hypothetical protein
MKSNVKRKFTLFKHSIGRWTFNLSAFLHRTKINVISEIVRSKRLYL